MKWTNKCNESFLNQKNINNIDNDTKFCIYGAGKLGGDLYKTLKHYDMFFCFIDNNHSIQEKGYKNEAVISENEYFKKEIKYPVIICASDENTLLIESDLKNRGLIHNKNYYICREFTDKLLPIIAYKFFNETFMSLSQICVTERCTLHCKKCAHGCYNVPMTKEDMTLEQVKKSADIFFSKVNYIHEFVLIGGEPLLYKHLTEAVEYIGSKYRNQMSVFSITSNGTITPSKDLLEKCKEYGVLFRISNYSATIAKLELQYEKLRKLFITNNVEFRISRKEQEWMDYGFDYYKRECDNEQLINVFDACGTPCHEIRENKFYYCVMARSVADNLSVDVGKEDYLDFEKLSGDNWRRELLEFIMGYSEKGYLDMCRYCHGADSYQYPIPAVEQV